MFDLARLIWQNPAFLLVPGAIPAILRIMFWPPSAKKFDQVLEAETKHRPEDNS